MIKNLISIVIGVALSVNARAEVSLEQCLTSAEDNYPLIAKYDLLAASQNINLSDINKSWLPRIGVFAQTSIQNVVPLFPSALSNVMQQMGGQLRGLGKLQYKVGVDFNQTIWDGGASKANREVVRARSEVDRAILDVDMYAIRQRVESLYFGILLLESQIDRINAAIDVYKVNLATLNHLIQEGVAMQSDADMVEAQMLELTQQSAQAQSAEKAYRDALSLFTALDLADEKLSLPSGDIPLDMEPSRPEQTLFDSQQSLNVARRGSLDATLMPKIGLFAQSYYGYPGIDYFKAMNGRDLTFNVVAGVKVSWNIDAFYKKKNSLKNLDISNRQIEVDRETFLFNNSIQSASQLENIRGIEAVIADDGRIVELRRKVRKAAESQLANGVIDATALTLKINDETQAELAASYHTIQRLQAIYDLKNTLNR